MQLKVYAITLQNDPAGSDDTPLDRAQTHVQARVSTEVADRDHHEPGFVIIHKGKQGIWLNWWAHNDIRCQLLAKASLTDPSSFQPATEPLAACVWEAHVITHENQAWVRNMLTATPQPTAYLDDWLAQGLY